MTATMIRVATAVLFVVGLGSAVDNAQSVEQASAGVRLEDATAVLEATLTGAGRRVTPKRMDPTSMGIDVEFPMPASRSTPVKKPAPSLPPPESTPGPSGPPGTTPVTPPAPPAPSPVPPKPPGPSPFMPAYPSLEAYRTALESFRGEIESKAETGGLSKEAYGQAIGEYRRRMELYKEATKLVGEREQR